MDNLQNLSKQQLIALVKKTENLRKRGWAKYFQVQRDNVEGFREIIQEFEYFSEPVPDYFEKTFRELVDKYKHKYECSICLCDMDSDNIDIQKCGHLFHKDCIIMLKKHSSLCPLCRKEL